MMKVSVVVATFGDRLWAQEAELATASVADQGSHEIIILHRDDATLASVRNEASACATGDWICHLDADDRLDAGYLDAMAVAAQEETMRSAEARDVLLVPAVSFVGKDGCTTPQIPAWDRNIFDVNCAVIGTLIPRLLFARIGGFHEWPVYEDWDVVLRCIAAGAKLVPVPDAVYCARAEDGTGRNTNPDFNQVAVYEAIRREHAEVPYAVWAAAKT